MRRVGVLLVLGTVATCVVAAASTRPRGVGPEFAKFYKSEKSFRCISDPTIDIDISQINDDYCDCPDGSDEPGTSACAHLSGLALASSGDKPTLALPGFYCKNKGHQPSYVPVSNVNDGVCDYDLCCDGSDEWEGVGGIVCEDKCKEIGKEWRKQDAQRKKALGAGQKRRKELVEEAGRLKKEVEDRVGTLQVEIRGIEEKVKNLERQLADTERSERSKVMKGRTATGRTGVLANLAKDRVEELRGALITVRNQRDSARRSQSELEVILAKFKDEYNPNFNDEGVKRAVRAWDNFLEKRAENPEPDSEAYDIDLNEIQKPDNEENGIDWQEWLGGEEESDIDVLYKFEEYLPESVRTWIDKKLRDLRTLMVENGLLAARDSDSVSESKAVKEARDALVAGQTELAAKNSELTNHQADLQKDYGLDDVFRALKGQCVKRDSGEYTYELCWADRTTQLSKKGGGDTGMGNFARMDKVTIDDEVPPDGKGLGSGERLAMRYENGQHCWNGPNRSTFVVLACAEKDEIWKITEEEKCVYRMEVGTPAVCDTPGNGKRKDKAGKDEL